jgi:multimeric flavodoxin WrbA
MNILVLGASPNWDGLTAACTATALAGIRQSGVNGKDIRMNDLKIGNCQACGNGWGTCLNDHLCQVEDDFQALHGRCREADGLVLVTPVYWGEPAEVFKAFSDRLRRCEATRRGESGLKGKPVIAVAAAGGSGNGMITCLASMERWIEHVQARKYDFIAVNRWNREVKMETIHHSVQVMIRKMQETWE